MMRRRMLMTTVMMMTMGRDDHKELLHYRYAPYVVFIASPCLQTIQVNTKHTKESLKRIKHTQKGDQLQVKTKKQKVRVNTKF